MKASVITVDEAREFFEATRFRCDEGVKERCSSGLTQLITPLRNIMAANAMKYLGACFWRRVRLFVCHRLRQLHPKGKKEEAAAYNKKCTRTPKRLSRSAWPTRGKARTRSLNNTAR